MKKIIAFSILFSLFSCSSNHQHDNGFEKIPYIISQNKPIYEPTKDFFPGPEAYYSSYNFVIGKTEKVYFHTKHRRYFCITGIPDSAMMKPNFVDLKPSDFVAIDKSILEIFLKDNIHLEPYYDNGKLYQLPRIVISSVTDTLNSDEYYILMKFIKSNDSLINYSIRKITEEENIVLDHKIKNIDYYRYNIKWSDNFLEPKESWDNK